MPFSVTPFQQAYDFLKRNAPQKRLVLGGWGGVARNLADFHKRLPMDIVFSCLSDSLGWDPIDEVFRQDWKAGSVGRSRGLKTIPRCGCRSSTSTGSSATSTWPSNTGARE